MELTTLSFKVSTDELVKAKVAIDDLAKSMQNLNKVQQDEAKSAKVEQEVIKESGVTWKKFVADRMSAYMKLEGGHAAAMKRMSIEWKNYKDSAIDSLKGTDTVTESVKKSTTALEKQQKILEYMTQGFSKGQASILATANAAGTATGDLEKLGEVLQTQRKLMGASPFDKSMSGLVALTNQYGEIREAMRQYNAESNLSRDQTRELARDKERIIEKMKLEGASLSQIKQAVREYNTAYTEAANKVNNLTKSERERERAARDTTNAARNLQAAEERLFATVAHLNDGVSQNSKINERAALAIGSYERNLRLAGISGEEAAKKLMKYKAAQEQVSSAEAKNRASYISRGIGVQMGDVGVSLASGMNPLTVAIQQGDQIRGLIQQSGLEAAQMGAVMQQAFGGIVQSFKDVGVAMGSFVLGGLKSMGDGVLSAIGKVTGLNYVIGKFRDSALSAGPPTKAMVLALSALDVAASVAGGAMAALLSALGLVGIAMYKSAKANDELLISITTSGAALGMTSKELATFANANNIAGTSANDLKIALGELAAAGFKQRDSLVVITQAAQKYSQATGKDLNDVMKEYATVTKEPVDSLIKLAEATGLVSSATIMQAQSMIEAGDTAGAIKLAIEAYANAQINAADNINSGLSELNITLKELKKQASEAWDSIVEFSNSNIVVQSIRDVNSAFLLFTGLVGHASIVTSTFFDVWKNPLNAKEKINEAIEAMKTWDSIIEERNKKIQSPRVPSSTAALGTAANSAQAETFKELLKLQDKYGSDADKLQNKMEQFAKTRQKILANFATGSKEQLEALKTLDEIQKNAQDKYDKKANKDILSEQRKNANYYATLLEKISDLNVRNTATTRELTKAEQLLNDAKDDKRWNKLLPSQRKEIENRIENAKAIELERQAFENKKSIDKTLNELNIGYDTFLNKQMLEIQNRTASIGLLEEQKQVNEALLKIDNERLSALDAINKKEEEMKSSKKYSPQEIKNFKDTALSDLDNQIENQKTVIEQATRDSYQQQISFSSGWDSAFANYLDAARNTAERGKKIFQGLADGMADAITQFAMTGKISMKDFANSFIAELIRMEAKTLATSFLGGAKGGIGSFFSTAFSAVTGTPSTASYAIPSGGYGWAEGGYTGPGGVNEPAGIVHKGEVVWSQSDVAKAGGVGVVEGMRQGLRGYADGGLVGNRQALRQGDNSSSIVVNVSVASDGTSQVETSPQQAGPQLGNLIAAAVRTEIMKEKRNGGLLAGR